MGESKSNQEMPEWKHFFAIGLLLVGQSWFDLAPGGPWESRSFSRGVIGLVGLSMVYLAWFRVTFNRSDRIVPSLDLWTNPEESLPKLAATGITFVIGAWFVGNMAPDQFPAPTGLLLNLFGMLMLLQSLYVWMVISGPLNDEDLESE